MRVQREVGQHRFRTGERLFGINHPVEAVQGIEVLGEGERIRQVLELAAKLELIMEGVELFQEQSRQYPYGKEEAAFTRLPLCLGTWDNASFGRSYRRSP